MSFTGKRFIDGKEENMKYTLGKEDLQKILKGLCIALAGSLLTYISSIITQIDFGTYTPLVVAFWSVISNTVVKILDGVKK